MTRMPSLRYLAYMLAVCGSALAQDVHAQLQKPDEPHQKYGDREPLRQEPFRQEPFREGGYQAPPPTGALQGPTREFGLTGGEIELPAIRLRFPRVRLPAFSVFVTPPQMQMEPGVAPFVAQVQDQVSVPTGSPEALREPFRYRDDDREQFRSRDDDREPLRAPQLDSPPFQKSGYDSIHTRSVDPAELAWMKHEMDQFEQRIDQKLAMLAQSVELLAAAKRSEAASPVLSQRVPGLAPLPRFEEPEASQVSYSTYQLVQPALRSVAEPPQLRRLPPMTK